MTTLTVREIYDVARGAGFTPAQAVTWTSIAFAESRGRTTALNDHGEYSVGLWQINLNAHKDKYGDLHIPANNAKAAYDISHHGTDMRPWTTCHDINKGTASDYRHYLKHVEDVIGVQGDSRGVHGYYSKLPPPLHDADTKSSHEKLEAGNDAPGGHAANNGSTPDPTTTTPQTDHDQDGLPDQIEERVGTNPLNPDSDRDGLPDAMEASLGTNPTLVDTDLDGITDALEVRNGTDPLTSNGGLNEAGTKVQPWTLGSAMAEHPALAPSTADGAAVKHSTTQDHPAKSPLGTFLKVAKAQVHDHDHYRMGATPNQNDKNPSVFDCSSFTQWSAHQAGFKLDRTAEEQYMQLKKAGLLIKVEDAIHTPGALMFSFSSEPTPKNPRPWHAHVVISDGKGRTYEAKGHLFGVGSWPSTGGRFQYAAVIPGISDKAGQKAYAEELASKHESGHTVDPVTDHHTSDHPQTTDHGFDIDSGKPLATVHLPGAGHADLDSDQDGLTDAFEKRLGTNPYAADTDGDGASDWLEIQYHTDPLSAASNLTPGSAGGLTPGGAMPGGAMPGGVTPNGVTPGGVTANELAANGLTANGLTVGGLSAGGLTGGVTAAGLPADGLPAGVGGAATELSGADLVGTALPAHGDASEILDLN